MSKSCLITVVALIASVSAKPYIFSYGTLPPTSRAAYTAAGLYNPAAVAPLPAAYPVGYPTAYSATFAGYPASYAAPFSEAYSAPFALPAVSAYGSSYSVEQLAALQNPLSSLAPAPVAPFAPIAVDPLTYASPYSYVYKR